MQERERIEAEIQVKRQCERKQVRFAVLCVSARWQDGGVCVGRDGGGGGRVGDGWRWSLYR